jgi:hypothetical protein
MIDLSYSLCRLELDFEILAQLSNRHNSSDASSCAQLDTVHFDFSSQRQS